MLADWENKYRKHWPHHYRDVLDKINSPLGTVVVGDMHNSSFEGQPVALLEKSFKQPTSYKITVKNSKDGNVFHQKTFAENELSESIEHFIEIIGGWEEQKA